MGDPDEDARLVAEIERFFDIGLEMEWHERAYTSDVVNDVIARLQTPIARDLAVKLRIAGITRTPYVSGDGDDQMAQACETCMYYGIHRRFRELPELLLPVRPEWSCRLRRI